MEGVKDMFGFKDAKQQLIEERQKSAGLAADLDRTNADLLYLSMMTGVDLDEDEEEVMENVE